MGAIVIDVWSRCAIAIALFLLLTDIGLSQAQSDSTFFDMFTGLRIGNTVPVFYDDDVNHGHIYVFVDAGSCFTCGISLNGMKSQMKVSDTKADIVVFIIGKNQEYAEVLKKRNGWNFQVVADPIYAYRDVYKVKAVPFFYVTDRSGKILLMDKCGGVHVGIADVDSAIKHAGASMAGSKNESPIRRRLDIPVVDSSGSPLTVSRQSYTLWSPRRSVVFDAGLKMVHVVDSVGNVSKSWDLGRYGGVVVSPLEPTWAYGDSVLLCGDVGLNPIGRRVMYFMNVNTGSVRKLDFNDSLVHNDYYIMTKLCFVPSVGRIVVGLRPRKNQKLSQKTPMLLLLDSNAQYIRELGVADSIFQRYSMSDALLPLIRSDREGTIYECQSPSRRLNIYDQNGVLTRTIYPHYGSQRRDFHEDMPELNAQSLEYWVGLNQRTSHSMYIFPDSDGKALSLVYLNADYPSGVSDPMSSEAKLTMYLHRMTADGVSIDNDDIALPEGAKPFCVDGDRLGVSEFRNDRLSFVWYDIVSDNTP